MSSPPRGYIPAAGLDWLLPLCDPLLRILFPEEAAKRQLTENLRIEKMKHADRVMERILYFDGTSNMRRLFPIRLGEDVVEQHQVDLALEVEAVSRLTKAIALCRDKGDNGTRELLEGILADEEEHIDWLEAQLHLVETVGKEQYLAEQIHD